MCVREKERESARKREKESDKCPHFLLARVFLDATLSLFTCQRERKREIKRERKIKKTEGEKERVRKRERERESDGCLGTL